MNGDRMNEGEFYPDEPVGGVIVVDNPGREKYHVIRVKEIVWTDVEVKWESTRSRYSVKVYLSDQTHPVVCSTYDEAVAKKWAKVLAVSAHFLNTSSI